MQNLIHQMNIVLGEWRTRFDIMQSLPMQMTVNDRGEPLFNHIRLPHLSDLVLERAHTDPESICFHFSGHRFLKIAIHWPEEDAPEIRAVFFGYGDAESADF